MRSWFKRRPTSVNVLATRFAPLLLLLLLMWLTWRLASLIWWVASPPQLPTFQPASLGSNQPSLPDITRFSLFEVPKPVNTPPVVSVPVEPQIAIKLEGAMIAGSRSSVILRVNDKPNSYRLGQKLPDSSYRVREIYWNRVVLRDAQGKRRIVKFGDPPLPPTPDVNLATASPVSAASNPDSINTSSAGGLNQAVQALQGNRDQYLNQLGVNASGNGLEITDRTPESLRSKIGLRSGDRILSVNGQKVGNGNEAQLLEQVKSSGQARIEIQRGSQIMTVQQNF